MVDLVVACSIPNPKGKDATRYSNDKSKHPALKAFSNLCPPQLWGANWAEIFSLRAELAHFSPSEILATRGTRAVLDQALKHEFVAEKVADQNAENELMVRAQLRSQTAKMRSQVRGAFDRDRGDSTLQKPGESPTRPCAFIAYHGIF